MIDFLVLGRIGLASVFFVAGFTKLINRIGIRHSFIAVGFPLWLVTPLAIVLSLIEVVIAMALLSGTWAWWGAIGGLVLLLIFTIVLGINFIQVRQLRCGCFGSKIVTPIGKWALIRNQMLAGIACIIVWIGYQDTGPSITEWLTRLPGADQMVFGAGILCLSVSVAARRLLTAAFIPKRRNESSVLKNRSQGMKFEIPNLSIAPVSGLPVGSHAPSFILPVKGGGRSNLADLLSQGKPVMLLFTDPDCIPCDSIMSEVLSLQVHYRDRLNITIVSRHTGSESLPPGISDRSNILLQANHEVANAYKVIGLPSAVIINEIGTIYSPLALGLEAIRTGLLNAPSVIGINLKDHGL